MKFTTPDETIPAFDLKGLRYAFQEGRGQASGTVINVMAACSPAQLEKDGWIERAQSGQSGRWEEVYQPTQKLKELP